MILSRFLAQYPLLVLLVAVDLFFVTTHVWLWRTEGLGSHTYWNLGRPRGFPEYFNYVKWLMSTLACCHLFVLRREWVYLAWAALFAYFFFDDMHEGHETVGAMLVATFSWGSALALRGQDFGELAVSAVAAVVLLGAIVLTYRRSDTEGRRFTHQLVPWLVLLVFCGVGLDMLGMQAKTLVDSLALTNAFIVAEESGEMFAASVLTAIAVTEAATTRSRTRAR